MTLNEFYSVLKTTALQNGFPLIRTVVQSPAQLDYAKNLKYGVFTFDPGSIDVKDGFLTWSGNLYYVNRLFDERGTGVSLDGVVSTDPSDVEDQAFFIQSQGVDVLYDIIYSIDAASVVSVSFQPFTHRFLDYCAGVIAVVTFKFPYLRTSCLPGFIQDGEDMIGSKVITFEVSGVEESAYRTNQYVSGDHPWLWISTSGTPNWYTDKPLPSVGDLVWNEAGTSSYEITAVL